MTCLHCLDVNWFHVVAGSITCRRSCTCGCVRLKRLVRVGYGSRRADPVDSKVTVKSPDVAAEVRLIDIKVTLKSLMR